MNIRNAHGIGFNMKQLLLQQVLRAICVFFCLSAGSASGQFAGGSGTIADPYQVSTIEQLQEIRNAGNTEHFILINDIDASASAGWNNGLGFNPIGWFAGSLDGNGYTISNLVINRPNVHQTALFTHLGGAGEIKNISLENVSIHGGSRSASIAGTVAGTIYNVSVTGNIQGTSTVGGVVGQVDSNGSIINSHADVVVSASGHMAGGLLGNNNSGTLTGNSSAGSVSGVNRVGGLVGSNAGDLSESFSSSSVNGSENVGGLVGFNHNSVIEKSYSTGPVSGDTNVGGLAGFMGWNNSLIRLSFSTSDVTGSGNQVGGLIGRLQSGQVENAFARGDVIGNNRVGGLVGEMLFGALLVNTYSTGDLSPNASGQVGGLVGRNNQGSSINSFWDIESSGFNTSALGVGKTTAQMLEQTTYTDAGWDFSSIWSMDPNINNGYPFLQAFFTGPNTYFSRQTGSWDDPNTWSVVDHFGPPSSVPGMEDVVIIGANHSVFLVHPVALGGGTITVNDTGRLVCNNYVISGTGQFLLGPGGTLDIGSASGIRNTANEGNIQTTIRSFSILANYVYNGSVTQQTGDGLPSTVHHLRIDNPAGVNRSGSLTVNGQLQLDNGIFTMSPGSSLIAYDIDQGGGAVRMQVTIDGGKGWRMIGSPVLTDYSDLLNGFVSQGYSGSDFPSFQPNILWFDEEQIGTTNMAWRAPGNISNLVEGGRGHFFYVFDGAGTPGGGTYPDVLPITMDAVGVEHFTEEVFDFGVTHTPRSESSVTDTDIVEMNTGWNLLANPSTASISWDDTPNWYKHRVDNAVYIWDPAANNGHGDFLFWNGQHGTMESSLIAPFQAFWVRANNTNPALLMSNQAKTTGGMFLGGEGFVNKSEEVGLHGALQLKLQAQGMTANSFISFNDDGLVGEDPYDVYQLEHMSDTWIKLFTGTHEHHLPMVVNNLPGNLTEMMIIPVYADAQIQNQKISGPFVLQWELPDNWPQDWKATLMDHAKQVAIPMQKHGATDEFFLSVSKNMNATLGDLGKDLSLPAQIVAGGYSTGGSAGTNPNHDFVPRRRDAGIKTAGVETGPRFSIVINPGDVSDHPDYIAPTPFLLPVYPNPARHQVTIRISLPFDEKVELAIYDIGGRLVEHIANEPMTAGQHSFVWHPSKGTQGVFTAIMYAGDNRASRKIVVVH